MSFFGDLEKDLQGILDIVGDAPLGEIQKELEQYATQIGKIATALDRARDSVQWTGAAADAFHTHADQQVATLRSVVGQFDDAAKACGRVRVGLI